MHNTTYVTVIGYTCVPISIYIYISLFIRHAIHIHTRSDFVVVLLCGLVYMVVLHYATAFIWFLSVYVCYYFDFRGSIENCNSKYCD